VKILIGSAVSAVLSKLSRATSASVIPESSSENGTGRISLEVSCYPSVLVLV
jgi:hypothetical protein